MSNFDFFTTKYKELAEQGSLTKDLIYTNVVLCLSKILLVINFIGKEYIKPQSKIFMVSERVVG